MEKDIDILIFLANQGCIEKECDTTTGQIASTFGFSQQTSSRKLRDLEGLGLITRGVSLKGLRITITKKGKEALRTQFLSLKKIFEKKKPLIIRGKLFSGIGEGKYYVGQPNYQKQFKEKLGFYPFFGTLNIRVDPDKYKEFTCCCDEIIIEGFSTKERTYGKLICYKVHLGGNIPAALVVPERTAHNHTVMEILAPVNLRRKMNLKDGDTLKVE